MQAHVVVGVPANDADRVFGNLERTFETSVKRLLNLQELKRHRLDAS